MLLPQGGRRGEVSEMELSLRDDTVLLSQLLVRRELSSMFTSDTEYQEKCRQLEIQMTAARIIKSWKIQPLKRSVLAREI